MSGIAETVRIAAQTPVDRDRYLDLVRVAAVAMVVIGHWFARVVTGAPGALEVGYVLNLAPPTQWLTLLWQVMPVFFLVGGMLNAESWQRASDAGATPAAWIRRRAARLVLPLAPLMAVLVPAAALIDATVGHQALVFDFGTALFPLWFLAAYLVVTALTPLTHLLHRRGHSMWLIGVFVVAAVAVDLARFLWGGPMVGTQPAVGGLNFLFVWVGIHQLGHLWADGKLPARPVGQAALGLAGAAALVLLIGLGPWPLTMVPLEGVALPNNGGPPTVALFALGLVQLSILMLVRGPATRLLERPALWAPVALAGPYVIALYVWHQPVMVAVGSTVLPAGWFPLTAEIGFAWWALRPLWLLICLVPLLPVVIAARRFEPTPPSVAPPAGPAGLTLIAAGVVMFAAGIGLLIATGFEQPSMPLGLPWPALALLAAGILALIAIGRRQRPGQTSPESD